MLCNISQLESECCVTLCKFDVACKVVSCIRTGTLPVAWASMAALSHLSLSQNNFVGETSRAALRKITWDVLILKLKR